MKEDTIQYEILEDGTISITTPDLSGTNHKSADELLKQLATMAGGNWERSKRKDRHAHDHAHNHVHHHA